MNICFSLMLWIALAGVLPEAGAATKSNAQPFRVSFLPAPGSFTTNVSVTLKSQGSRAICYTLDGSEPLTNSMIYTSALHIARSTRIRARVFTNGNAASGIFGAAYTIMGKETAEFSSNLPLLIINTYGQSIIKDTRVNGSLSVIPAKKGRATLGDSIQFQGRIGIELRGSSSLQFPKKSYRLEIDDETSGRNRHVPLLGLPADSDWVLYAPYTDKTFMRDVLAYDLWEEMGHYSVRRRFVEVFCNQNGGVLSMNDYVGIYVLLEKIKRSPSRVNIAKLNTGDTNEPAISGGYILKKDRLDANDNPFTTSLGHTLGIEYPKGDRLARAQKRWLNAWFDEFESVLMGTNYTDPVNGYAKYIDVPTAIDHYWIVEMPKTIDGYVLSMFMYKDRGGKLFLSPIWDRNLSFGNANYHRGEEVDGWFWEDMRGVDLWYRRLFADPDFDQKHIDRWGELRAGLFATSNLMARIDRYATLLEEAQKRDFERWPRLGVYVWPNAAADWPNTTYAGTVNFLKNYTSNRLEWIDSQFLNAPVLGGSNNLLRAGSTVTLSSGTNRIYFTLDGTDPRNRGGAPKPGAKIYAEPLKLSGNARLFARAQKNGVWSPPLRTELKVIPY